ncbi:MAG: hypothetical protein KIT85_18690 [Pseudolabrys sp.]|nr:hypothetical protein [Pseudolabrys sp.]MCW5686428.1 hypothetical protein [Pseudolabrys sp.]
MPDRNTSHHSHDHGRATGRTASDRGWAGTSLHDQYRAIGISAVAAAMRWPDPAPDTDQHGRDRRADELPLRLRDLD